MQSGIFHRKAGVTNSVVACNSFTWLSRMTQVRTKNYNLNGSIGLASRIRCCLAKILGQMDPFAFCQAFWSAFGMISDGISIHIDYAGCAIQRYNVAWSIKLTLSKQHEEK